MLRFNVGLGVLVIVTYIAEANAAPDPDDVQPTSHDIPLPDPDLADALPLAGVPAAPPADAWWKARGACPKGTRLVNRDERVDVPKGTIEIHECVGKGAWPCASWTDAHEGSKLLTTYEWDEHHNLVRREIFDGYYGVVETWGYDASGQILVDETRLDGSGETQTHRELADGRVAKEMTVHGWPDRPERAEQTTTFQYEAGRLIEKLTDGQLISGVPFHKRTTVTYPFPDMRVEVTHDLDIVSNDRRVTWVGEPWRERHEEDGTRFVEQVARILDEEGRLVHSERRFQEMTSTFPDEIIEILRAPDGAPITEINHHPNSGWSTVTTYTNDCPNAR